ncbi:MAG TPA: hypothetical protein PKZ07_14460 [Sedimentisphaerales bacterium]|nr:hypothetical protein [Sedimentisphaerales bacterium]
MKDKIYKKLKGFRALTTKNYQDTDHWTLWTGETRNGEKNVAIEYVEATVRVYVFEGHLLDYDMQFSENVPAIVIVTAVAQVLNSVGK